MAAGADERNDRLDPGGGEALADSVRVVASVERGELQDVVRVEAFGEDFKLPAIVSLASAQVERDDAVFVESRRMDFGGEAALISLQASFGPPHAIFVHTIIW